MAYNGWTNWETWNVNLWLSNDEAIYHDVVELARNAVDAYDLGKEIEQYVDNLPDVAATLDGAGIASDFLRAGLHDVDWKEIADGLFEEAEEEDDDEDEDEDDDDNTLESSTN